MQDRNTAWNKKKEGKQSKRRQESKEVTSEKELSKSSISNKKNNKNKEDKNKSETKTSTTTNNDEPTTSQNTRVNSAGKDKHLPDIRRFAKDWANLHRDNWWKVMSLCVPQETRYRRELVGPASDCARSVSRSRDCCDPEILLNIIVDYHPLHCNLRSKAELVLKIRHELVAHLYELDDIDDDLYKYCSEQIQRLKHCLISATQAIRDNLKLQDSIE